VSKINVYDKTMIENQKKENIVELAGLPAPPTSHTLHLYLPPFPYLSLFQIILLET